MTTETFTSDGTWTVPSDVDKITVRLYGGQGTSEPTYDRYGGEGGFVEFELSVSAGQTFTYYQGTEAGQRDPSFGGGSATDTPGGGASVWISGDGTAYDSFSDWVGAAAGGGGIASSGPAGDGGPDTGEDAGNGSSEYGLGGSQTSGGYGGSSEYNGNSGGQGYGGGAGDRSNIPGGGDGWYGGGAGSYSSYEPVEYAAGGGSNYVDSAATALANQRGGNTGDGYIEVEYYKAPVAPDSVSVDVNGNDSFTVTWSGDQYAQNYRVQRSYDGGSWTTVATPDAGDRDITDTNDNNANDVQYRVRTENKSGSSDYTYSPTITTDPANLSVTGYDATSVSLSWDGVGQSNSYEVQRSEGSGYSTVANPGATSYTDTGLENGEQYTYRVRANYDGTDSDFTPIVTQRTTLPSPTIDSLSVSSREIVVSYSVPDNSTDGNLVIERSRDGGSSWTTLTTVSAQEWPGSYTDSGLLDGERYTYRLTRSTDHRSAQSGTSAATTPLPATTDLTADEITATSITVSWAANHNYGETRVQYRRTSDSTWTTDEAVAPDTEQHTITGLLNGEEYDIRVVAATEHDTTEDQ